MLDHLEINDYVEIPYITPSGEHITYYCGACGFMSTEFFYGDAYLYTNELKGDWVTEQAIKMVQKGNEFLNNKIKTGQAEKLERTCFSYNNEQIFINHKTKKLYLILQCFVENAEMESFEQFSLGNDLDYYLDDEENIVYILVNNKIGKISDVSMHDHIHASVKLTETTMRADVIPAKFYTELNNLVGTKIAKIERG